MTNPIINKPESLIKKKKIVLTSVEKQKLSRAMLLEWFRKKRDKLKALQEELRDATASEKEAIKERIIRNTKKELEKMKYLAEMERTRRAEEFADDVMRVSYEMADIERVMKKYDEQEMQEKIFFGTLNEYVGNEQKKNTLRRLFKSEVISKKVMPLIKRSNPTAYYDIEHAYKKGDYEAVKKLIVDASNGILDEEKVDHIFAEAVLNSAGKKKLFGVKSFSGLLAWIDQVRAIGHGFAIRRASRKTKIPYLLVLRLASKTFNDLKFMDDNLQQHRHLIEMKQEKTLNDEERIKFIEGIHKLRDELEKKLADKGLRKDFTRYLSNHLDKRDDLTKEDKIHIINNAKIENLRLLQIYELLYADDENREQLFMKTLTRIPTLLRFHRKVLGENREFVRTVQEYHFRRLQNFADWQFKRNARRWGLGEIVHDIDEVERMAKGGKAAGKTSKVADLFEDAKDFKSSRHFWDDNKGLNITAESMYHHDRILGRYHALVMRATKLMSDKAKGLMNAGKHIETVQKTLGQSFWKTKVSEMPHLSDQTLRSLVPDTKISIAQIKKMNGAQLIAAYGERAVDLKNMQDFTRTRFSALAETIDKNIRAPFSEKFDTKMEILKGTKERKQIMDKLKDIREKVAPSKGKYYAKRYGLPAIIIGLELSQLATGKSKAREVMWDLGEAAAGFVPVAGTILDFKGAISGQSLSGRNLSTKERIMYAGFGCIGLVADAAIVIGGLGLGLRAGLGGLRMARRSVEVGKGLGEMKKVAVVRDTSLIQRMFGRGALALNKAHQAEEAVEATITAKAYEQARLMSKYGINGIDDIAGVRRSATAAHARELDHLRDLLKGGAGGVDYIKMFERHILKTGGALKIPKGFFGRGWLRTKETFKKMSVFLRTKLGVSPQVIRRYERSFDAVKNAEKEREAAMEAMKIAEMVKVEKLSGLREAYETYRHGANWTRIKYMSVLDKHRDFKRLEVSSSTEFALAERKYEALKKEIGAKEFARLAKLAETNKGKKIANAQHREILETYFAKKKKHEQIVKNLKKVEQTRSKMESEKALKQYGWRKDIAHANDELLEAETTVWNAQKRMRVANDALHFANTERSMLQMRMMQRADSFVEHGDKIRIAAHYFQKAGLVSGLAWYFAGMNPVEQTRYIAKGAGGVVKGTGYVGKKLLFTDRHREALDIMIESRVNRLKRQRRLDGELAYAQERGKTELQVYAENWGDPDVRELARRRGIDQSKVRRLLNSGRIQVRNIAAKVEGGAKRLVNKARGH